MGLCPIQSTMPSSSSARSARNRAGRDRPVPAISCPVLAWSRWRIRRSSSRAASGSRASSALSAGSNQSVSCTLPDVWWNAGSDRQSREAHLLKHSRDSLPELLPERHVRQHASDPRVPCEPDHVSLRRGRRCPESVLGCGTPARGVHRRGSAADAHSASGASVAKDADEGLGQLGLRVAREEQRRRHRQAPSTIDQRPDREEPPRI